MKRIVTVDARALDVIALVALASMVEIRPTRRERMIGWQSSEFDSSEGICKTAREVLTDTEAGSYVAVPRELLERAIEWIGVSVAYRECGATREAIRALLKVSP